MVTAYFPEMTKIGLAWCSLLNLVGPIDWTPAQKSEINSYKNSCSCERSVVNPCNLVKPSIVLIKICSIRIAENHQCSGGFHECWCSSRNYWSQIGLVLNQCNTLAIDIHLVSINCRHLGFINKMRFFCHCKFPVIFITNCTNATCRSGLVADWTTKSSRWAPHQTQYTRWGVLLQR